uniref:CX domain-containing protein n=1 Tax=Biomphalaria glabrata TaxID=6526 RepID=A0A2C9LQW1_BIOGL|nr:hypothetical protein BgiMline_029098 [Biomphalaria glabrata]
MGIYGLPFYIALTIFTVVVNMASAGQTCTFTQSSTNIAIYCENGCCSNKCCTTNSVDTDAIAIGVSVALAVLILILLIALLIYCCHKRNKRRKKTSDMESTTTEHTDVMVLNSIPPRKTNLTKVIYYDNTRYSQTGEPAPPYLEKVIFGRSNRWTSFVPGKKNVHKVHPLRPYNAKEKFTQTKGNQPTMIRPVLPATPLYDDEENQEKSIQTPVHVGRRPPTKDKPKGPWAPHAPWQPHAGEKSLSKTRPKPLDTYANYGSQNVEQQYTSHRCSPELGHYKYESDYLEDKLSSRASGAQPRPSTIGD